MRTLTHQFVLVLGTWLFFGSGGPVFAGIICGPAVEALIDDPSADPPPAWLARGGEVSIVDNSAAHVHAATLIVMPGVLEQNIPLQQRSPALLARACEDPGAWERRPRAVSRSSSQHDEKRPTPTPPKPPGSGDYGAAGRSPSGKPRHVQFALAASSATLAREGEGDVAVWYLPPASEPHALPLFRPPRRG